MASTKFLSTPSARRATSTPRWSPPNTRYFYPRPPRGGRPARTPTPTLEIHFYPRPPRGGRHEIAVMNGSLKAFLSTPSARRATLIIASVGVYRAVFLSTPSARRATADPRGTVPTLIDFYPRPPRGGRPMALTESLLPSAFLSTPSARRATRSDHGQQPERPHFYPRPPRGGRRWRSGSCRSPSQISIHALREEGDPDDPSRSCGSCHFYPRPPRGGRLLSM